MSNIDYFKKFMPLIPDLANMNFDVWSYTRVSSKEQFTNNSSVSNQKDHNIKYAKDGKQYRVSESEPKMIFVKPLVKDCKERINEKE